MGKFGWDLPPGCTHQMIEDALGGDEGPCDLCGGSVDGGDDCCVCHECSCGMLGDVACIKKHGYVLTPEQIEHGWKMIAKLAELEAQQKADEDAYARSMEGLDRMLEGEC